MSVLTFYTFMVRGPLIIICINSTISMANWDMVRGTNWENHRSVVFCEDFDKGGKVEVSMSHRPILFKASIPRVLIKKVKCLVRKSFTLQQHSNLCSLFSGLSILGPFHLFISKGEHSQLLPQVKWLHLIHTSDCEQTFYRKALKYKIPKDSSL